MKVLAAFLFALMGAALLLAFFALDNHVARSE
jgi:hypothetical protein